MANPQHDSSADFPSSYDPYTTDGIVSPTDGPFAPQEGDEVDVKEAGTNYDKRNRGLRYGKCVEAPRII